MKHYNIFLFFILILGLSACGGEQAVPDATEKPVATQSPDLEPVSTATTVPATEKEASKEETPILSEVEVTASSTDPSPPAISGIPWHDRTIYQAGLIESEQAILAELPGATVYHLDIELAKNMTQVSGNEHLQYTNQEDTALDRVYFHLFPNLLGGSIELSNVLVNGTAVQPKLEGELNSLLNIPLTTQLQPGETVEIEMDFVTGIPQESGRNYGIFAFVDNVLALAHFYPQVTVYDDETWNIATPAESGDVTYADMSFYRVTVTAPIDQVMAASGVEILLVENEDLQTITFAAGPMRDFFLAASAEYEVFSTTVGEIQVNSYAFAELMDGARVAADVTANALAINGERFGAYPYTEFDIVGTPTLALGVEYPGIVANTLRIYDLEAESFNTPNQVMLESTTAHEVGHQWFYNLVGNDQLDEPWIDESLTQYATYLYFLDRYGRGAAESFYGSLEGRWGRINNADIPIAMPVGAYEGAEYSGIIYGRGPIFVRTLAQEIGIETMDAFLKDYSTQFRWGISNTEAFQSLAEQHCSCNLDNIFAEWIYP